jgi:predicted ATPase
LSIDLKSITLLVGEQGCGKSTLLSLLSCNDKLINVKLSESVHDEGIQTLYFDSEKMNPRVVDIEHYTNPNGTSRGIGVGAALKSRFMSHGEVLREFTVNGIKEAKDCVLLLDEPESALSLANQYRLARELQIAVSKNVQIIASTHCLPLIESVNEVYSLEHNRWMTSEEFVKSSKKNT